jgi:hypothetical protein
MRVRSCPTNSRQCAFGCVPEKANVETIKQAKSEARTGYGPAPLISAPVPCVP